MAERGQASQQAIHSPTLSAHGENEGLVGSTMANLAVIVGFAAFAYTVKWVIRAVGSS